ncbi:BTB/POZ domain-containing protein At3g49900 isoform X1 [Humulus lupulus]|uniref:BTB/POZ domain-containing protein At3g49900 isoform X1 n=1 Tax=Humulus lupulus TaxID=3486 RepID=UPI002B41333F|nr:BTB/POZ domain-containing protein At3g49900 isoform X1 [Humulus lupulus]
MKAWKNLGSVDTIYEEEYEFSSSSSSSSLSPTLSSPPTPLHSRVRKWSQAAGRKTEVVIRVRGKCFLLHKDPLRSKSTYLKRQLTDSVSEFTLSPPLNISAETFTLVADFCYGAHLVVTPFNFAALRTAAELLEMTDDNGDGEDNLVQFTDSYFRRVVAVNKEYASIVFRSSLSLLPESETAAFLMSKCVDVLNVTDDDGCDDGFDLFEDVILTVHPDDFHMVAEAMQRRFNSHDVVYKIVEQYIRGHNGKMTEDQKSQICSCIDCDKLSPTLLVEAVQNPIMPLRFLVRAMLVEQLNTRHRIISTATTTTTKPFSNNHRRRHSDTPPVTTLGALLQRDAALRQNSQLKASLDATTLRIQSLEEELSGMKKLLRDSHLDRDLAAGGGTRRITDHGQESARSASFHFGAENKVAKGDKPAASSASFRLFSGGEKARATSTSMSSSCKGSNSSSTPRSKKISERLMSGLKKAFWVRSSDIKETKNDVSSINTTNKVDLDMEDRDEDGWNKYSNEIALL